MSEVESGGGRSRALRMIALVVIVVVAVVVVAKVVGGGDSSKAGDGGGTAGPSSGASVPAPPETAPGQGTYVQSTVAADGSVAVQEWVRSPNPIRTLQVAAVAPQSSGAASAEAVDVVVQALDGSVLAKQDSVGADVVRLQLRTPVPNLYLSYRITGGVDDASQTVQGRMLAEVLAMDVDYSGSSGTVQRKVTGPGTVTNVACLRVSASADTPPKPCGGPTDDGGWLVTLRGIDRTDRLIVQLDSSS